MHLVLVGATCAGKTTLAEYMAKRGFRRIITYTTRPKRDYEIDASKMSPMEVRYADPPADYFFVSQDEFDKAKANGYFAETTSYNASFGYCEYGSTVEDWKSSDDTVCVLNPDGVRQLKQEGYDIFVVYINTDFTECIDRARQRGDDDKEIARRMAHDITDLKSFENEIVSRTASLDADGNVIPGSKHEEHLYDIMIPCVGDLESVAQNIMSAQKKH